jgi:hypothetical protein
MIASFVNGYCGVCLRVQGVVRGIYEALPRFEEGSESVRILLSLFPAGFAKSYKYLKNH